jgi:hypothetical protein
MKSRLVLLAGSLLLFALKTQAQGRFEISPFYGYRWGGGLETVSGQEISLQDGRAYGLALNYSPFHESEFKLELLWSRQDSSIDLHGFGGKNQLGLTVDEFQIGALFEKPYGKLHPYVSGLVGASLFGPEGADSETRFSLSIGGGVKYFLLKNLALRADVRGYCTVVESDSAFISVGGVTVAHFSGSTLWQGEVSGGVTLSF